MKDENRGKGSCVGREADAQVVYIAAGRASINHSPGHRRKTAASNFWGAPVHHHLELVAASVRPWIVGPSSSTLRRRLESARAILTGNHGALLMESVASQP